MIYWSICINGQKHACSQEFGREEMSKALQFAEALRMQQRQGNALSHITLSSENPDSVGHAGVADVMPGYNWRKRR